MRDTERNRRRLVRFIAQEVKNEQGKQSGRAIPHFNRESIGLILKEAQRRSGRRGRLSKAQGTRWLSEDSRRLGIRGGG